MVLPYFLKGVGQWYCHISAGKGKGVGQWYCHISKKVSVNGIAIFPLEKVS
jgi:hypothetical protein